MVSRVSVASVAHVNSLGGVYKLFGINQSETRCPLILSVRAWVSFALHCDAPGAGEIAYLVIPSNGSEPEFHCRKLSAGCPRRPDQLGCTQ